MEPNIEDSISSSHLSHFSKEVLMDKNKILTIVGIAAVAGGTVCLFLAGKPEALVSTLVGVVFVVIGVVISFFKK